MRPRWRPVLLCMLLSACGLAKCAPAPLKPSETADLYARPLTPPDGPLSVYHLGHSLVGRDMPAMLAQLAGPGHRYDSQLGSGVELQAHWEPDIPIRDFETANDHPRFRPAHEAVASGDYDAVVLTEKIGIEASIRYHDSWRYLSLWADKIRAANPEARVYLYETWHGRDTERGWLNRLERDLPENWEREILDRAMAADTMRRPIYVIPAGQVFAALERRLAAGPIGEFSSTDPFFRDRIHLGDHGNYLVALTHYAVLYGRSPVGLPHALDCADGSPAEAMSGAAARALQEIVWQVVTAYPRTGVGGK